MFAPPLEILLYIYIYCNVQHVALAPPPPPPGMRKQLFCPPLSKILNAALNTAIISLRWSCSFLAKVLPPAAHQKTVLKLVLVYAIVILAASWYLINISWKSDLVWKVRREIGIDCQSIFDGSIREIGRVKDNKEYSLTLVMKTSCRKLNCTWVLDYFNNNFYTTELEKLFPIVFTFLIHNSAHQLIRLLKLLYRPHNQYCIAIDKKSKVIFINIFRNIVNAWTTFMWLLSYWR